MFPINGKPLGPGGCGNLDLLRESRGLKYHVSVMREMMTPIGTAKQASIFASSSMVRRAGEKRCDAICDSQRVLKKAPEERRAADTALPSLSYQSDLRNVEIPHFPFLLVFVFFRVCRN
jgi:hypothetical protein